MFDLEKAIAEWRRQAEMNCTSDASALDELEDHLREDTAELVRRGNAEQQAWIVAVAKLGDHAAIRREFAKVARLPLFDRCALSVLFGVAAVSGIAFVALFALYAPNSLEGPVISIHVFTITLGYLTGIFAAILAAYATLRATFAQSPVTSLHGVTRRSLHVASIAAAALTLIGFIFGAIWSNGNLGRTFSFDPREIGALIVATTFIAGTWATRNERHAHLQQAIAAIGGGIVLAAWLGPAARLHGYPAALSVIGFGGLAAALVVAALALRSRDAATQ